MVCAVCHAQCITDGAEACTVTNEASCASVFILPVRIARAFKNVTSGTVRCAAQPKLAAALVRHIVHASSHVSTSAAAVLCSAPQVAQQHVHHVL